MMRSVSPANECFREADKAVKKDSTSGGNSWFLCEELRFVLAAKVRDVSTYVLTFCRIIVGLKKLLSGLFQ